MRYVARSPGLASTQELTSGHSMLQDTVRDKDRHLKSYTLNSFTRMIFEVCPELCAYVVSRGVLPVFAGLVAHLTSCLIRGISRTSWGGSENTRRTFLPWALSSWTKTWTEFSWSKDISRLLAGGFPRGRSAVWTARMPSALSVRYFFDTVPRARHRS
jgi:hypothetical protein